MLVWQIINFCAMALIFVGGLLLSVFNLSLRIDDDDHLMVNPKLGKVATRIQKPAIWAWAVGFVLQVCYQIHLLRT
jgi:hypothetical protein